MPVINIRKAESNDEHYLRAVYFSTRRDEVSAFGWDEAQQNTFLDMQFRARQQAYRVQFPNAEYSVITVGGDDAGCLTVERSADKIHLVDIAILTKYRGRGVATHLIKQLQAEAAGFARSIILRVDIGNIKARELYERLGFRMTSETQVYFEMEWNH